MTDQTKAPEPWSEADIVEWEIAFNASGAQPSIHQLLRAFATIRDLQAKLGEWKQKYFDADVATAGWQEACEMADAQLATRTAILTEYPDGHKLTCPKLIPEFWAWRRLAPRECDPKICGLDAARKKAKLP